MMIQKAFIIIKKDFLCLNLMNISKQHFILS